MRIGSDVVVEDVAYTLVRYIDLYSILAVRVDNGERVRLAVTTLLEAIARGEAKSVDDAMASSRFETLSATDWGLAQHRAAALAPMLSIERSSRKQASAAAEALGIHVATVYRWVKKLKASGEIADLAPHRPSGGRGRARIDPLADALIRESVERRYLQPQRPLVSQIMRDIELACRRAGVTVPHANTVRRRISLDSPSEVAVGMCLVHAILPKDSWLGVIGVQAQWPIWGVPSAVHADNGKEFHGAMITRAAQAYRFRVEWRKVKMPNWGGHIERLLGTFNQEVHTLPGTTFSNTKERGTYAPHTKAVLTLGELERYLTEYICNVYQQRIHSALGRPPLKRYEAGVLGDGVSPGVDLAQPIADPKRLRLDFMPVLERSIQSYGLRIDGLSYYDSVLDPWVRATDPQTKKPLRFVVRRDPRDISIVHFLDPNTNRYYPIPYRQFEWPSMSLWELREVRAQLKREGRSEVDEELIFTTYERLNQLVADAQSHSVKARKAQQKKRDRVTRRYAEEAQSGAIVPTAPLALPDADEWDEAAPAKPFDIRVVH